VCVCGLGELGETTNCLAVEGQLADLTEERVSLEDLGAEAAGRRRSRGGGVGGGRLAGCCLVSFAGWHGDALNVADSCGVVVVGGKGKKLEKQV
jgi:hypothetical protein